jgi:hypothetical protein
MSKSEQVKSRALLEHSYLWVNNRRKRLRAVAKLHCFQADPLR